MVYTVPFDLVDNAKLILTDKLIVASRPIDMTCADTIVEEQED